jgi:hypothetical protein
VKTIIRFIVTTVILVGLMFPQITEAQSWGKKKKTLWENWSINLNAGLTSFFGDLSKFDSEIMEKLTQESGVAFSGILTKDLGQNHKFGVSGQLLHGSLKGANNSKVSFESTVIEYNFHCRINLINLFSTNNRSKMGIALYGGVGQFIFKTTKFDRRNNENLVKIKDTGTPEFIYFFGAGLSYKVINNITITVDASMRQTQNDYLDDFVKNNNPDYYTYLSLGAIYNIDLLKKSNSYYKHNAIQGKIPGMLPMRRRR